MEIDLRKGPEHAARIKFMIILLAIVFIIVIALIIFIGVREPEVGPVPPEIKEEVSEEKETIEEPETQETQETELTEAEIEQVKLDIVTGKTDEVPEELDTTKRLIVKEYLSKCHDMPVSQEKYDCFELYYTNNDDSLMQKKNECESLTGQEKTDCFDQYYYKLAFEINIFCDIIKNDGLKNQCFTEFM